jgi:hypothetical protein
LSITGFSTLDESPSEYFEALYQVETLAKDDLPETARLVCRPSQLAQNIQMTICSTKLTDRSRGDWSRRFDFITA